MPFGVRKQQGDAHLWALGRACCAWWDPIPRGGHCQRCGYPQQSAGPTCPARALGPHRLSRWWLPSIAKHANLERIRDWRGKKYMWSIHKWDHKSFPHCNRRWASPIAILDSLNRFRSPPVMHHVCHANTHMALQLVHHLCICPPTVVLQHILLPSPPYGHSHLLGFTHPLFRMRCTAVAHSSRIFIVSLPP